MILTGNPCKFLLDFCRISYSFTITDPVFDHRLPYAPLLCRNAFRRAFRLSCQAFAIDRVDSNPRGNDISSGLCDNTEGIMGDWRSGSAGALQAQGRGFKSLIAHHKIPGHGLIDRDFSFLTVLAGHFRGYSSERPILKSIQRNHSYTMIVRDLTNNGGQATQRPRVLPDVLHIARTLQKQLGSAATPSVFPEGFDSKSTSPISLYRF